MRALVQMLGADSAVASCASDAEKIISPAPTYPFLLALRAQSKPLLVITSSSRAAEDLANELRELHLLHVLSEHFMGRPVRLRGLGRGRRESGGGEQWVQPGPVSERGVQGADRRQGGRGQSGDAGEDRRLALRCAHPSGSPTIEFGGHGCGQRIARRFCRLG